MTTITVFQCQPGHSLTSYFSLRKKYNEINVQLGQTGAGLSFEAINGNEKMKSILGMYFPF